MMARELSAMDQFYVNLAVALLAMLVSAGIGFFSYRSAKSDSTKIKERLDLLVQATELTPEDPSVAWAPPSEVETRLLELVRRNGSERIGELVYEKDARLVGSPGQRVAVLDRLIESHVLKLSGPFRSEGVVSIY